LSRRRYKAGYEIRNELKQIAEGEPKYEIKSAYTIPEGWFIGSSKWAYRLCTKMGIKPEISDKETDTICSIGWCEKEKKWYGWSHRAIFGFGIGSKVEKGDCAYVPANPEELLRELQPPEIEEGSDLSYSTKYIIRGNTVVGLYESVALKPANHNEPEGQLIEDVSQERKVEEFIYECGRGEWIAESFEDAKQMAIDFAEGVS
jgi:hypothetical protein